MPKQNYGKPRVVETESKIIVYFDKYNKGKPQDD
jgi:hypothetical protein